MGLGINPQQAKCARVRTRALLANLRSNNDCGLSAPLRKRRKKDMSKENRDVGAEMIMANDVTEIRLVKVEYHWEMGYNEFDFACRSKGQENTLYLREQRHDDGTGFVIHSEK